MDLNTDDYPTSPAYLYAIPIRLLTTSLSLLLLAIMLFLLTLHLYRHCRVLRGRLVFDDREALDAGAAEGLRGLGLDAAVLASLPILVFRADGDDGAAAAAADCAVCLGEFADGEKLRSLPRCGHRFHVACIDMWFHTHATCPLCRSAVVTSPLPTGDREAPDR